MRKKDQPAPRARSLNGKRQLADAVEAIAARKQQSGRGYKIAIAGMAEPTPEQRRQRPYAVEPLVDEGMVRGKTFRRQPLYVTLSKTSHPLTPRQRQALDLYRETFDRADRSYTSSCLNPDRRHWKPDSILHANEAVRHARETMAEVERCLGALAPTLIAVALEDRSFTDIAMERFGSRKRSIIDVDVPVIVDGKQLVVDGRPQFQAVHREQLVPRSSTHRTIVSTEYMLGVVRLADAIRDRARLRDFDELWVAATPDGRAEIKRGTLAPRTGYRMRGSLPAIEATLIELAVATNGCPDFASYQTAKGALIAASDGRLTNVDADEGPVPTSEAA